MPSRKLNVKKSKDQSSVKYAAKLQQESSAVIKLAKENKPKEAFEKLEAYTALFDSLYNNCTTQKDKDMLSTLNRKLRKYREDTGITRNALIRTLYGDKVLSTVQEIRRNLIKLLEIVTAYENVSLDARLNLLAEYESLKEQINKQMQEIAQVKDHATFKQTLEDLETRVNTRTSKLERIEATKTDAISNIEKQFEKLNEIVAQYAKVSLDERVETHKTFMAARRLLVNEMTRLIQIGISPQDYKQRLQVLNGQVKTRTNALKAQLQQQVIVEDEVQESPVRGESVPGNPEATVVTAATATPSAANTSVSSTLVLDDYDLEQEVTARARQHAQAADIAHEANTAHEAQAAAQQRKKQVIENIRNIFLSSLNNLQVHLNQKYGEKDKISETCKLLISELNDATNNFENNGTLNNFKVDFLAAIINAKETFNTHRHTGIRKILGDIKEAIIKFFSCFDKDKNIRETRNSFFNDAKNKTDRQTNSAKILFNIKTKIDNLTITNANVAPASEDEQSQQHIGAPSNP